MGRFYNNQHGEEGKFWVAVQPSDDPRTVYGMDEVEPDEPDESWGEAYMEYWADDYDFIKMKLDQQYDKLKVPKENRKYDFENTEDIGDYVWEYITQFVFTKEKPKDSRVIGTYFGKDDIRYPISEELELAASRIDLGLFILHTIAKWGECSITAEL